MIFTSQYTDKGGSNYLTTFFARDPEHAVAVLTERGMNEVLFETSVHTQVALTSTLLEQWRFADAMHAACWLGMVACASRYADGFELLRDRGLIHSIAHLVRKPASDFAKENLTDKLRQLIVLAYWNAFQLEIVTPGFEPEESDPLVFSQDMATEPFDVTLATVKRVYPEWCNANRPRWR